MINSNVYANKTSFAIKHDGARYAWAAFYIFVFFSSLFGDTTILVASVKYKAFRLHKLLVAIIQHIAICDLSVSLFQVFPTILSLIADDWVLGNWLCFVHGYAMDTFVEAGLLLICFMATGKMFILKYPFRVSTLLKVKDAHIGCAIIWIFAMILPATLLLVDRGDVGFGFRAYICSYLFTSPTYKWLVPCLSVVFLAAPNVLVSISTIMLLLKAGKVARRGRESLKWQGIMTASLTAGVYVIANVPYAVYYLAEEQVHDPQHIFHNTYYRIAVSLLSFNTISNFYIYSLTVSSFRSFLGSCLLKWKICIFSKRSGN